VPPRAIKGGALMGGVETEEGSEGVRWLIMGNEEDSAKGEESERA
jgi:hypothetical protein